MAEKREDSYWKSSNTRLRTKVLIIAVLLGLVGVYRASAEYLKLDYPASTAPGGLQLAVTYTLWIPPGAKTIRGIIVHQHGAGGTAAKSGEYAAYDLHWQALAKKWDCALLAPSYHVGNGNPSPLKDGSQLWYDPHLGSEKAFLKAIDDFAVKSGHPELNTVPWVLFGHSAGGYWSDIMTSLHPDRVAVLWLRSGTKYLWPDKLGVAPLSSTDAILSVPTILNFGVQEKDNFIGKAELTTFSEYSSRGAPATLAIDPLTGHWTGNSRYLAIPFIDACLALRLPDKGSKDQKLKPINMSESLFAPVDGSKPAVIRGSYKGDLRRAVWLPNATIAKDWSEFIKTGNVSDDTPPPPPFDVKVADKGTQGTEITWDAEADFESGIRNFIVLRDGQELGSLPAVNLIRFQVRPTFQAGWTESYNDAPANPVPQMTFIDPWPKDNQTHTYAVITVNTVGLKSKPSAPVTTQISK